VVWAWVRFKGLTQEGTERKDEGAERLAGEAIVGGTAGAENFVILRELVAKEKVSLDFGIEERDMAAQRERFPPNLLRIVGDHWYLA
jgi:hypothetical protein